MKKVFSFRNICTNSIYLQISSVNFTEVEVALLGWFVKPESLHYTGSFFDYVAFRELDTHMKRSSHYSVGNVNTLSG